MKAADEVIALAGAEIGYLEKSRKNWDLYGINCLYKKTEYAGADNVTKYAWETGHYNSVGWSPWCMTWVVWVLTACFGKTKANDLLCGMYNSASTMDTKNAMIKAGRQVDLSKAQKGDIVFRSRNGGGHVGLVKGWQDGKIVTIEGNTSATDKTAWNGGCVASHVGGSWQWCCRPDWSIVESWRWVQDGGKWYYQNSAGQNVHGWRRIQVTAGEFWYYFDKKGAMQTGVLHDTDGVYYLCEEVGQYEGACCKTDDRGALIPWSL